MRDNHPTPTQERRFDDTIREMIKHENELVNHRISWFSALHGLLFAALGFAWDKNDTWALVLVFSGVGALLSISAAMALHDSHHAIDGLSRWWRDHKPKDYAGPGVIGLDAGETCSSYLHPWWLLPPLFCAAWLLVAGINWDRRESTDDHCAVADCKLRCPAPPASGAAR